ncbi:MAG: transposase [Candidatus Sericytochromatia bacterium]
MANKKYSKEFKVEALELADQVGGAQAARSLGIRNNLIYRWRHELSQSGGEAFRGHGNMTSQEAELARLRRENANLKEDREICAMRSSVVRLINSPTTKAKKALEIFSQKNHKYV